MLQAKANGSVEFLNIKKKVKTTSQSYLATSKTKLH